MLRVDSTMFHEIVNVFTPRLKLKYTWFRKLVGLRIAMINRHLTGKLSFTNVFIWCVAENDMILCSTSMYGNHFRVCSKCYQHISKKLNDEPFHKKLSDICQFYHVLGAKNWKHVAIKYPAIRFYIL